MSISSINRSAKLPAETLQSAETAKTGTHNDRIVSKGAGRSTDSFSSLSSSIPQDSLRSRSVRRPTTGESRGLFNTLRLCFGGRQQRNNLEISSPKNTTTCEAQIMAIVKGQASGVIEASQRGIAAARSNIVKGLSANQSSEEVTSFLKLGDKGIRRGTTAIQNLGRILSFENLSDKEKREMPAESLEALEKQSAQIKEMAKTVSGATFLDGTRDFFQCGTSERNGYVEMMEKHPEQDQAMRGWVRNGLTLGSELINTQEQILLKGNTQSENYLNDLQSRVNIFASIEKDLFAAADRNSEMEGFAGDVLNKIAKETEV